MLLNFQNFTKLEFLKKFILLQLLLRKMKENLQLNSNKFSLYF